MKPVKVCPVVFLGLYARMFEEVGNFAFCYFPVLLQEMSLCSVGFRCLQCEVGLVQQLIVKRLNFDG